MFTSQDSMKIHGHCNRCKAPIFLNQCTDWYGNTVLSLNCWNGHYKWIEIEDIDKEFRIEPEKNLVTYIGFFDAP
ncbi:hypothetical protein [Nitrospina gracilis]|uniref:hypothetical protein n=1 Tax=Nitrospina gracilis TaxID=35801 RepID=UPI001F28DE90|nr:hypothetical protein [Nitrospina gracilis]MCF8721481.1 hypothetical protein [Nitrospina gracilis Nb-211]